MEPLGTALTFGGTEMNVTCDVQPVEMFRLSVKDSIWLEYEKTGSRGVEHVTYPPVERLNRRLWPHRVGFRLFRAQSIVFLL